MLVTIDGPAGAGKSTLAKLLAARLSWNHIDSGALYRAAALLLDEKYPDNVIATSDLMTELRSTEIRLSGERVFTGHRDLTAFIRTSHIDEVVSELATISAFRDALTNIMRHHAMMCTNAIIDGRDIGSVVFPKADLKIYLNATLIVRARRRLSERPGRNLNEVMDELRRRDLRDSERTVSPMKIPLGALVIDTTQMAADQVLEKVIGSLRQLPTYKVAKPTSLD